VIVVRENLLQQNTVTCVSGISKFPQSTVMNVIVQLLVFKLNSISLLINEYVQDHM